jgi:hypothetical protein
MQASLDLNLWLSQKFGIDSGHVWYHASICCTNCPGTVFLNNSLPLIKQYIDQGGGNLPSSSGRRVEPEMATITEVGKPLIICPPPGNSVLEVGVDFADANVRLYGHVEGTDRWENKSFNTRPGQDQWYVEIGPSPNWAVDKINISVAEFNKPGGILGVNIWPI